MSYMVGKLEKRGICWCKARIFCDYYLEYRILLTLWQQSLHYSQDLVVIFAQPLLFNLSLFYLNQRHKRNLLMGCCHLPPSSQVNCPGAQYTIVHYIAPYSATRHAFCNLHERGGGITSCGEHTLYPDHIIHTTRHISPTPIIPV